MAATKLCVLAVCVLAAAATRAPFNGPFGRLFRPPATLYSDLVCPPPRAPPSETRRDLT